VNQPARLALAEKGPAGAGPLLVVPAFSSSELAWGYLSTVPVDSVTNSLVRRLLARRLGNFEDSNCGRVFAEVLGAKGVAYSAERLRETARRTNF
jgi:hypothetical protein